MEPAPIFHYELCPSLIDEYGYLRKGSKAPLAHTLSVQTLRPLPPDVTIVDLSQLLYHISRDYHLHGEKILVFDKYYNVSAKDNDQQDGTTMSDARYRMYTRKSGKLFKIM